MEQDAKDAEIARLQAELELAHRRAKLDADASVRNAVERADLIARLNIARDLVSQAEAALEGVRADPNIYTGNPLVDRIATLRAEVARLRAKS